MARYDFTTMPDRRGYDAIAVDLQKTTSGRSHREKHATALTKSPCGSRM